MRKQILIAALTGILFVNPVLAANPAYVASSSNISEMDTQQNRVTQNVIYVENGEGTIGAGKGTKDAPYQNIRTALENIQDGDILKLIGIVRYTTYEQHIDGSAKPLFFNKQITVEGNDEDSGLMVRTTIQLGADVTFRNMNLQMIPKVILGRMLGTLAERSTTIFAAGHNLTLDNVNTKLTSSEQESMRPYISGGAYMNLGTVGKKAVIRVINPSSETKLGGIYAGDYWSDREMDVEVHLDGNLIDTELYAGGVDGILNGNVDVTMYNKSNISRVDSSNHMGNVNVTVAKNTDVHTFIPDGINELVLENKARMVVPETGRFHVKKVILNNEAVIDFRYMNQNPEIAGDFTGTALVGDVQKTGAVLLNNTQTLKIAGNVSGLTRLNTNGIESMIRFVDGHAYISANKGTEGSFTIEGTTYTEFEIRKITEQDKDIWTVCKKEVEDSEKFNHFSWQGGQDKIICPDSGDEFEYPIIFYKNDGTEYMPDIFELLDEFEYNLVRHDGKELDLDWDIFIDWDTEKDESDPVQLKFIIYNLEKAYGEFMLTVTHLETGKQIQREIKVLLKDEESDVEPSQVPTQSPNVEPSQVPTQSPSVTPTVKPSSIKLDKTKATIYTDNAIPLQLKASIVGTSSAIQYTSSNSKVAKVDQKGRVTAVAAGNAVITAEANGVKAFCTVTVKKTSLNLNITSATIYTVKETTTRIKPTIAGSKQTATYGSSNNKIAKVDKNGKVTAVKTGTAVITVKANGVTKKCKIIVKKPELKVAKAAITVKIGKNVTISAKATPKSVITFVSGNNKIATVNKHGVVTGVKAGTTTITVKCNGITKKVSVKVKK